MLCDDETLEDAVSELQRRFKGVVKVQIGKQIWQADSPQTNASDTPDS